MNNNKRPSEPTANNQEVTTKPENELPTEDPLGSTPCSAWLDMADSMKKHASEVERFVEEYRIASENKDYQKITELDVGIGQLRKRQSERMKELHARVPDKIRNHQV